MLDEYRDATEMEADVLGLTEQWSDDVGLTVYATVVSDGHGGEAILTDSVVPQFGETEYIRPIRTDSDLTSWRQWIEHEFAPSWY